MPEHTPGPWSYKPVNIGHPDNAINPMVSSDSGLFIARIGWQGSTVPYMSSLTPETFDEAEANARLIAAAPDYDDLLERFTTYIQTKLLANIRSIEGGQSVIDGAWDLVAESHGLRKRVKATEPS